MPDLCQAAPSWAIYLPITVLVLAHLRTLLPPQAQGAVGVVLAILDKLSANYGNCKNAPVVDQQGVVTPRP